MLRSFPSLSLCVTRARSVGFVTVLTLLTPVATLAEISEGFTQPYTQVDLAIPEPGIISQVYVEVGDRVKRGQLIASLDHDVLLKGLAIARARAGTR